MKENYKVIFVDDELAALQGLAHKVKRFYPSFEVLGTYQKPKEAIAAINKNAPDILFLDIAMPNITGFELLNNIPNNTAEVIFVTAYNQYALEALKRNAVDYILKPIANEELKNAIDKTIYRLDNKKDQVVNKDLVNLLRQTLSKDSKLLLPTTKGMSFIPQEEVLHLEGYKGYTKIHLIDDTTILSSYNIGKFELLLGEQFFKCHKSHIVNIDHVRSYENDGYLLLNSKCRVPISRLNRKVFLALFE